MFNGGHFAATRIHPFTQPHACPPHVSTCSSAPFPLLVSFPLAIHRSRTRPSCELQVTPQSAHRRPRPCACCPPTFCLSGQRESIEHMCILFSTHCSTQRGSRWTKNQTPGGARASPDPDFNVGSAAPAIPPGLDEINQTPGWRRELRQR